MAYLLVVQIANVVSECGIIFEPFIIQYGELAAVTVSPKHPDLVIIVFITRSYILLGIVALLSMASFERGLTKKKKVFTNPEFRQFGTFTTTTVVWLALSASCDLVIATGMSHALYSRRRTEFKALDGRINQIIRCNNFLDASQGISISTEVFSSQMTTANFIVNFPLSAVYTCSILAMYLNSRESPKPEDLEQAHSAPQILAHSHRLSTLKAAKSALQSSKQFDAGYASST
ncbi:hypothetical protein K438DRAFT_1846216 [Mycena galopus ATCC 62051]|nr:hypothetical protein K438DRAFT_1846216 [Mycena galopus ATCC 62051]